MTAYSRRKFIEKSSLASASLLIPSILQSKNDRASVVTSENTFVYTWTDYTNEAFPYNQACAVLIGFEPVPVTYLRGVDLYNINNVSAILLKLNQMPEGHRAIRIWGSDYFISFFLNNVADQLPDKNIQAVLSKIFGYNLFWDNGSKQAAAYLSDFYRKIYQSGGQIDYIILDIERSINADIVMGYFWKKDPKDYAPQTTAAFNLIYNAAKNKLRSLPEPYRSINNADIIKQWLDPKGNKDIFDVFFKTIMAESYKTAFYYPARRFFPEVRCSNFGFSLSYAEDKIPDAGAYDYYLGGKGECAGTDASPALYGQIGGYFYKYPPASHTGLNFKDPITDFDTLILSVNEIHSIVRHHEAALTPWITEKSTYPYTYYIEQLYHLFLAGTERLLLWNGIEKNGFADQKLLHEVLKSADRIVNNVPFEDRFPLINDVPLKWDRNYCLSCLETPDIQLWRLTFNMKFTDKQPDSVAAYKKVFNKFLIKNDPLIFSIKEQEITFPAGAIIFYEEQVFSYNGIWIKLNK